MFTRTLIFPFLKKKKKRNYINETFVSRESNNLSFKWSRFCMYSMYLHNGKSNGDYSWEVGFGGKGVKVVDDVRSGGWTRKEWVLIKRWRCGAVNNCTERMGSFFGEIWISRHGRRIITVFFLSNFFFIVLRRWRVFRLASTHSFTRSWNIFVIHTRRRVYR